MVGQRDAILITGAGGQLGSTLLPLALAQGLSAWGTISPRGQAVAGQDLLALDLRTPTALIERVLQAPPRAIIHLAGVTSLAAALADPILAHELNVEATGELSHLAGRVGARFVFASTDMVFDGHEAPYGEDDTPLPTSSYARSKLAGEAHALRHRDAVIVRLPLLFGIPPRASERSHLFQLAGADDGDDPGPPMRLFEDEFRTPLSLLDAARALLSVALDPSLTGVVHAGGPERVSRAELARRWAAVRGRPPRFEPALAKNQDFSEPRPPDLSLSSTRYQAHFGRPAGQPLDVALAECAAQLERLRAAAGGVLR